MRGSDVYLYSDHEQGVDLPKSIVRQNMQFMLTLMMIVVIGDNVE